MVGFCHTAPAIASYFRVSVFFGEVGVERALTGEAPPAGLAQVRLHKLMLHQQVVPGIFNFGHWIRQESLSEGKGSVQLTSLN